MSVRNKESRISSSKKSLLRRSRKKPQNSRKQRLFEKDFEDFARQNLFHLKRI